MTEHVWDDNGFCQRHGDYCPMNETHTLDEATWTCSCGEPTWTPEAYADHLAEVNEATWGSA